MGTTQSAEEVKNKQIAVLGPEFGSLYNLLYNEIIGLHYKWSEFEELYCVEESRIKIMNNTAPFFFSMIQEVLWENIISGIERITGQPEAVSKKNMTIPAIPEFISDQELKDLVEIKITTILEKTKFCRDWGNSKIAHYDYNMSDNFNAKPLEEASKISVKEALSEIVALIHLLHRFYFKSTLMLDQLKSHRGALSLLYTLDDGLKERENYFNRSGTWNAGDINIDPNEIK